MPSTQPGRSPAAPHSRASGRVVWACIAVVGVLMWARVGDREAGLLHSEPAQGDRPPQTIANLVEAPAEGAPLTSDFSALLRHSLPKFDIDPSGLPESFRRRVHQRLREYTQQHRRDIIATLQRGAPYLPLIKRILRQQDLPAYYAYIPLAESAFHYDAAHPESGARGLWQLMPNTARAYGLQVSAAIDERLDPMRATQAASQYLRELENIFGRRQPLLVLAAYNYGENNLSKAIVRSRSRDVWELLRKRQLPSQTRHYLVKMVTLWLMIDHAEAYQLAEVLETHLPQEPFSEVTFPHPVALEALAEHLGLPLDRLRALNPQMLTAQAPAHTPIRVPAASIEQFLHYEVRLTAPLSAEGCCARLMVLGTCSHTVEAGETLFSIARRYSTNLATLKLLNQLKGSDPIIRPGQRLAVCDTPEARLAVSTRLW